MRERWRRRAHIGRLIWIFAVAVLAILSGWVLKAVYADDTELQRYANQSQVLGILLAAGTAVFAAASYLHRRLSAEQGVTDWAAELADRVSLHEEGNWRALLGTVHAADLALGEVGEALTDELHRWFVDPTSSTRMRLETLDGAQARS